MEGVIITIDHRHHHNIVNYRIIINCIKAVIADTTTVDKLVGHIASSSMTAVTIIDNSYSDILLLINQFFISSFYNLNFCCHIHPLSQFFFPIVDC